MSSILSSYRIHVYTQLCMYLCHATLPIIAQEFIDRSFKVTIATYKTLCTLCTRITNDEEGIQWDSIVHTHIDT